MNHKSILILRAGLNYDLTLSGEVLLDGQPLYSKKNKQLYIGDGESALSTLSPITSFEHINQNLVLSSANLSDENKNIVDDKELNSDGTAMKPISNYSLIIGRKNKLNSSARSLIVGHANEIDQDDLIGGSLNVVFGASNIVCGSTGLTVGNGNKVGSSVDIKDSDGNVIQAANPVNNCLVSGYHNDVLDCERGATILGNTNTVWQSSGGIVAGELNQVKNSSDSSIFGYKLKANGPHQHIVGVNNDIDNINPNTVFMVGIGSDQKRKNALEIRRIDSLMSDGAIYTKSPLYIEGYTYANNYFWAKNLFVGDDSNLGSTFKNRAININQDNINLKSSVNTIYNKNSTPPTFLFPDIRAEFRLIGKEVANNYYNKTDLGFTGYNDFWNNSRAYALQNRNEIAKLLTGQQLTRTKSEVDSGKAFEDINFDCLGPVFADSTGMFPTSVAGALQNYCAKLNGTWTSENVNGLTSSISYHAGELSNIILTKDPDTGLYADKIQTTPQTSSGIAHAIVFIPNSASSGINSAYCNNDITVTPNTGKLNAKIIETDKLIAKNKLSFSCPSDTDSGEIYWNGEIRVKIGKDNINFNRAVSINNGGIRSWSTDLSKNAFDLNGLTGDATFQGNVSINKEPQNDNHAVRLIDVKPLLKLVEGLTNDQILALNSFAKSLTM